MFCDDSPGDFGLARRNASSAFEANFCSDVLDACWWIARSRLRARVGERAALVSRNVQTFLDPMLSRCVPFSGGDRVRG